MTHEEYLAEKAAYAARVARRVEEAKAEYDRQRAAEGESLAGAARRRGGQTRRRTNAPILGRRRGTRTPCACGCGRPAFAKGLARPCYMAKYRREGPGRHRPPRRAA